MTTHQPILVGIREAAERLSLSHSTVSRYVKRYPHLKRGGSDARPLVDLVEFKQHRGENINVEVVASTDPELPVAGDNSPPAQTSPQGPNYNVEKARREAANATKAELELADRLNQVVPRDEVESGGFEVGHALREALERRNQDLAERLALMDDPAEIVTLLEQDDRRLLLAFAEHLASIGDDADDVAAA